MLICSNYSSLKHDVGPPHVIHSNLLPRFKVKAQATQRMLRTQLTLNASAIEAAASSSCTHQAPFPFCPELHKITVLEGTKRPLTQIYYFGIFFFLSTLQALLHLNKAQLLIFDILIVTCPLACNTHCAPTA